MRFSRKTQIFILVFAYLAVGALAGVYRFTQPVTSHALTQFDVFDWMGQSRNIQITGIMPAHNIWLFPAFNAVLSSLSHVELFSVYLFGGAVVTTLAMLPLASIIWLLTKDHRATLVTLLLYATMQKILARSVMYLPEAMTYLFGLVLLYLYVRLFQTRQWAALVPVWIVTSGYVVLHQSGLNFLAFSAIVTITFVLFFSDFSRKWRGIFGGAFVALIGLLLLTVKALRTGLTFFFSQSNGVDGAFQGDIIPYQQILSAYEPLYVVLFVLGVGVLVVHLFRKNPPWKKVSLALLLLVVLFYFSFLYILPSLNLYRLTPWRFYTWFSLFTLPIIGYGLGISFQKLKLSAAVQTVAVSALIFLQITPALISDNMFTADHSTLKDMQALSFPKSSVVITTNANYLQTKYALSGRGVEVREYGVALFKAADGRSAASSLLGYSSDTNVYVIISKYQLRQRPTSIDYWRASSIFDMRLENFLDGKYFTGFFENQNLFVYKVNDQGKNKP